MPKPSIKKLLNEILSDDLEKVYVRVTNKAIEWAAAGLVEEANYLLEQLWKYTIPHSKNVWLQDEALQIIWELSGSQPQNTPFTFKDISEIEDENWARNFYPGWHKSYTDQFIHKSIHQLQGQQLYVKAIISVADGSERLEALLEALQRFIEIDKAEGSNFSRAAICASLLAARIHQKDKAEYFIKLWGREYLMCRLSFDITYLMRDRATALFLLRGLLAPVFGITKEICQNETQRILEKLSQRIANGRTLVYKHLSWKQLLDKISTLAISQNTFEFTTDVLAKKSLSRTPATINEIAEIERKLNVIFPEDYKNFLLTSNGFECYSPTGVTLAPIEKVDFLISVDKELVDIWTADTGETHLTFNEKLKSSILIGGHEEEQQLLLIPSKNEYWECWHFSSWQPGEVVYQSFRFYMEHELQELEDGFYTK